MRIAANGTQVSVRDRGQGKPSLVFLHYPGSSSAPGTKSSTNSKTNIKRSPWTTEADAPADDSSFTHLVNDAEGVIAALKL